MTDQNQTATKTGRKSPGLWSALAYFAGVAALVAVIWVIDDPRGDGAAPEASAASTTTTTAPATIDVSTPIIVPGEEPIADAAAVILPSVVRIETDTGLGSGVIYDSNGLIVTAAHVVEGQDTVRVRFDDGTQETGTVLGSVSDVDIAVIQVDRTGLPAAVFTFDKPRVGQMAIAVGSPWGLQSTVTAGIISAVDQTANCSLQGGCASLVQTDAAINPGNSGGALVDRFGRVVGINVSIFSASGANDGVGFAVPSVIAMDYADSIVSGEPLDVAFLGVRGGEASGERAGAEISEIIDDTAAAASGLEVGDIIVFFDGVEIQGIGDLSAQVRAHRPGDVVDIILIRDGTEMMVEVTLGVEPASTS